MSLNTEPRKMPSKSAIREYWHATDLWERMGLDSPEAAGFRDDDRCFACGTQGGPLFRAHIQARCNGGADDASNLHVLCKGCHTESEFLEGERYWAWFCQMDPFKAAARDLPPRGFDLDKMARLTQEQKELTMQTIRRMADEGSPIPDWLAELSRLGIDIARYPIR